MANDRLRDALMTARVTHEELADELGVHTKTVERWVTQDRRPYEDVPSPVELRWRPQVIIRPRSPSHDCLWQGHSR
jgi:hypothetical protein